LRSLTLAVRTKKVKTTRSARPVLTFFVRGESHCYSLHSSRFYFEKVKATRSAHDAMTFSPSPLKGLGAPALQLAQQADSYAVCLSYYHYSLRSSRDNMIDVYALVSGVVTIVNCTAIDGLSKQGCFATYRSAICFWGVWGVYPPL